ncbi:MAG: transposase [Bacteroidales bacterium]|nr:transposase [Bacteroidales bacterium]
MPWKESSVMDERLRFVARLLEGEPMTDVCRDFGISRKTGYKLFERYKEDGPVALCDRSRRPVRYANQLPAQLERLIVSSKKEKPNWGARKIRELLVRRLAGDMRIPAISTIHATLDRHGLVKRMGKRRRKATGTALSPGTAPNDLWCADFKGEFKLGDGRYCYPLTITDHASRFILECEALESTREEPVIAAFGRLFAERGLPAALRTDNGLPFASPNGLYNLSKLSVWWLRLGIAVERIRPGHPQQNGRHERMHLTLKQETTRPPGLNPIQQQERFDAFRDEFNRERPHEALAMKCPADLYRPSSRPYDGLPEVEYPFHDRDALVTACGRICMHRKKINISTVLAGQKLGIKEVDDGIWLVSFLAYDLGYIDLEQRTLQTLDNPFGTRLSPMS